MEPMRKSRESAKKAETADLPGRSDRIRLYAETKLGSIYHGDSLLLLEKHIAPESVDLLVTSPPFGLVRKKEYGNVDAHEYLEWFKAFGKTFRRVLKPNGSRVMDIAGAWI